MQEAPRERRFALIHRSCSCVRIPAKAGSIVERREAVKWIRLSPGRRNKNGAARIACGASIGFAAMRARNRTLVIESFSCVRHPGESRDRSSRA